MVAEFAVTPYEALRSALGAEPMRCQPVSPGQPRRETHVPGARGGVSAGRIWAARSARNLCRRLRREAAARAATPPARPSRTWPNPDAAPFVPQVRFAQPLAHYGTALYEPGFAGPYAPALRAARPALDDDELYSMLLGAFMASWGTITDDVVITGLTGGVAATSDVQAIGTGSSRPPSGGADGPPLVIEPAEATPTCVRPEFMVGDAAGTGAVYRETDQQCIDTSSSSPLPGRAGGSPPVVEPAELTPKCVCSDSMVGDAAGIGAVDCVTDPQCIDASSSSPSSGGAGGPPAMLEPAEWRPTDFSRCPANHLLTLRIADVMYECDTCATDLERGSAIHECKACDYSICIGCHASRAGRNLDAAASDSESRGVPVHIDSDDSDIEGQEAARAWAAKLRKEPARKATWCPSGHQLQPWVVPTLGRGSCDGCQGQVLEGDRVLDCRQCNYYLCVWCWPQRYSDADRRTL